MRDNVHKSPPGQQAPPHAVNADGVPAGWTPLQAWRIHSLYAPVVPALKALLLASAASDAAVRPRILHAGGHPGALAAFLARAEGGPVECDVSDLPDGGSAAKDLDAHAYDCVVAMAWLPLLAPSRRQQQLAALCRAARVGIILVNPFDSPEAAAAQRAVNEDYRCAHGEDHPALGRLIEIG
ncbi:MAG: hypothetical protein ABI624_25670, partial [Casimicrobiaceae bacterium]